VASVFDTLFVAQATVTTISYLMLPVYLSWSQTHTLIRKLDLRLILISSIWMLIVLGFLSIGLYLDSVLTGGFTSSAYFSPYIGAGVIAVWLSLFLLFGQSWLIYSRIKTS